MSNVVEFGRGKKLAPSVTATRLDKLRTQLFQVQAIVDISKNALACISGDEDSLTIAEDLSTYVSALDATHGLINQIAEQMEIIGQELEEPEVQS